MGNVRDVLTKCFPSVIESVHPRRRTHSGDDECEVGFLIAAASSVAQ